MGGKHECEIVCGHLVFVLLFGSVIEEIQQQLEQGSVSGGQQQQQQLESLDLTLLIRQTRLIALIIKRGQFCQEEQIKLDQEV